MAADQNKVNANVERGVGVGELDSVIEGVPVGHKSGGREDALGVGIDNAGVHIASEAEIIRVNDQAFQKRKGRSRPPPNGGLSPTPAATVSVLRDFIRRV